MQAGKVRCAGLLQESLSALDNGLRYCSGSPGPCFFNDAFKFFEVDNYRSCKCAVDIVVCIYNRNKSVNEIENQ